MCTMRRPVPPAPRAADPPAASSVRFSAPGVGAGLLVAGVVWTLCAGAVSGGNPLPVVGAMVGVGATFASARLLGRIHRGIAPAGVLLAAALLAATSGRAVYDHGPLSAPFGYVNARGAFFALAAIAGGVLAATLRRPAAVVGAALAAFAAATVPLASGTEAAAIVVMGVPALAWVAGRRGGSGASAVVCGAVLALALAASFVAGATFRGQAVGPERPLGVRRLELWHEAIAIIRREPLFGVGPGRFAKVSPTARTWPDTRWAHNGFLHQGAEQGVVGMAILVAGFAWGFVSLGRRGDRVAVWGVAALAGTGLLASVDYVLHFPAIPLAAAGLVGTATARAAPRRGPAGAGSRELGEEVL